MKQLDPNDDLDAFRSAVAMCVHAERGDVEASWETWNGTTRKANVLGYLVQLPRVVLATVGVERADAIAHLERILLEHRVAEG